MAFSIPIVKKDYDIYNSNKHRQRRLSDCSGSKTAQAAAARHKSSSFGGSVAHPVSKSVGHSCSATPIGSSHVSTPNRRYSTSKNPSSSSSSSNTAAMSKYSADNLQKSKSLHTVNRGAPSTSSSSKDQHQTNNHTSSNSLAKFHTKLVDRLKNSITCSSSKKHSPAGPSTGPGSSKSTGHLDSKRSS
uniref:Uncharacterized protein n=1 Tax=Cacopsylla melanoneura TaxID=428564 RepID=A0A8D9AUJ5_9HEMI